MPEDTANAPGAKPGPGKPRRNACRAAAAVAARRRR